MYDNKLYHHGIKGQKWGIRRFQNRDGSRTSQGLEHLKEDRKDWPSAQKNKKSNSNDIQQTTHMNSSNKLKNNRTASKTDNFEMPKAMAKEIGKDLALSYGKAYAKDAAVKYGRQLAINGLKNLPSLSLSAIKNSGKVVKLGARAIRALFNTGLSTTKTGFNIAKTGAKVAKTGIRMAKSVM